MNSKLNALIVSLTPPQIKVLKIYLNVFAGRGDQSTQLCRLFVALSKKPGKDPAYYSNIVYGKQNISALKRLASRLYYKILDSLLIDINVNRLFESAEQSTSKLVLVRKIMLQYYILRQSNKTDEIGLSLLYKAKAISEQNELYTAQLEVLHLLKAKSTAKGRKSSFSNWDEQIGFAKGARKTYLRAYDWYNKYQELHNYQGNLSAAKHIEFLQEAVSSLQNDYVKWKSPTVKYFHGVLNTALLEQRGYFNEAIQQCKWLLEDLKKHPVIRTQARISTQYSNIAIMELQNGRLNEALKYNELSISVSLPNSVDMNYKVLQKVEILYYLERWDEAMTHVDQLIPAIAERYELLKAKAEILRATILFSRKEYKQAAAIFGQKFIISADKAGWELSVRIMRIMAMVEMGKYDEAEVVYQNLIRYSQRTNNRFEISERYKYILKILNLFSRSGFDLSESSNKIRTSLDSMLKKSETAWKYGTSELIPFDLWLEAKLRKKRGPKPGQKKKSNA